MAGVLRYQANVMFDTSAGLTGMKQDLEQIAIGLGGDLGRQAPSMAGAGAAGVSFAGVYEPAARTTMSHLAWSVTAAADYAVATLQSAGRLLAADDDVAAALMRRHPIDYEALTSRVPECDPETIGQNMPGIVNAKSRSQLEKVVSKYKASDKNDVARLMVTHFAAQADLEGGNYHRAYTVGRTWRKAANLVDATTAATQQGVRTMLAACQGRTFAAIEDNIAHFIGDRPPHYSIVDGGLPYLPNIAAACRMLDAACQAFGDHLHHVANHWWSLGDESDLARYRHLVEAVTTDTRIAKLVDLRPVLDGKQAHVRPPATKAGSPGIHIPQIPPFGIKPEPPSAPGEPPIEIPEEPPIVLAAAHLAALPAGGPPWTGTSVPPIPPPPGAHLLNAADQAAFADWAATLNKHGYAGGDPTGPAAQYQQRVAGYPEYDLPLPNGRVVQADGLRRQDAAVIDAKYVKDPNAGCTFRTLDKLQNPQPWNEDVYIKDEEELARYGQAIQVPGSQVRQVEIDTNGPEAITYWDFQLAEQGVPGYARFVP